MHECVTYVSGTFCYLCVEKDTWLRYTYAGISPDALVSLGQQRVKPLSKCDSSQPQSAMWDAADTLRGSACEWTHWKGYILPLLFFWRISDV